MKVTDFGATVKGDETKLYTLTNKTEWRLQYPITVQRWYR